MSGMAGSLRLLRDHRGFLGLLLCLYFAQGLPSGLIAHALPALLRDAGVSLSVIGLTGLIAAPWMLKFLWAPFVDRYGSRRRWLIATNSLLLLAMLVLALWPLESWLNQLVLLFALLAGVNLAAATQDIATDGLAVRGLRSDLRGIGNSLQVVGYKLGLILGGGVLLGLVAWLGWQAAYGLLALLFALALVPVLWMREPTPGPAAEPPAETRASSWHGVRGYLRLFHDFAARPGLGWWLLVVACFKVGDSLASAMIKPLLVDSGVSLADIGLMAGVVGSVSGVLGALLGGVLLLRVGHRNALLLFGLLQAAGLAGWALVAGGWLDLAFLYALSSFEQFADGLSTVALFTLMMDACRRDLAGTDYTLQASLFVTVSGAARLSGGFLTEIAGYGPVFLLASGLTVLALLPVLAYFRRREKPCHNQ